MVEAQTERIVGAQLIGTHADEVINLFALAIRRGCLPDGRVRHRLNALSQS